MTVTATIRDLDLEVPLRNAEKIRFSDPRTGREFDAYMVDIASLTEEQWARIHADVRARLPDTPENLHNFQWEVSRAGGLPLRADRIPSIAIDGIHARSLWS